MHSPHLISRCSWHTEFDQQSQAHELQDFLSEWSNTVLPQELASHFDRLCPATQTWRLDRLQLDLGDIAVDALALELPRRLRSSLQRAFAQMQSEAIGSPGHINVGTVPYATGHPLEAVAPARSSSDLLSWFLQHGAMPWWYRGTENLGQLWDRYIGEAAPECAELVRQLGLQQAVRQRLVWQLGEARVRHLVHLLEPWQGEHVCAFADELFSANAERLIVTAEPRQFRDRTWIAILTYLLVERGSLFNTSVFVRATLVAIAQQFHIPFSALLARMRGALQALAPLGRISAPFLLALENITQQEQAIQPAPPPSVDLWTEMQRWLQQPGDRRRVGREQRSFNELYGALASDDGTRMAQLLRQVARDHSVRDAILAQFGERELASAVRVLAVLDHAVIVAHITHASRALRQHGQARAPRFVWQVVLNFLLAQDMPSFQLRQLVGYTIEQLCKRHNLAMPLALDLLIFSANSVASFAHRFQLQQIFADLKARQPARSSGAAAGPYRAVLEGLLTRQAGQRGMPTQALIAELLDAGAAAPLHSLIVEARAHGVRDASLSTRLLQLAGPGRLAQLFDLLQPGSSACCLSLMSALQQWHQRGVLPALAGVDLALELPAMLLQALPGFANAVSGRFDATSFWQSLTCLLRKAGVDQARLARQLRFCIHDFPLEPISATAQGRAALLPVSAHLVTSALTLLESVWERESGSPDRPARVVKGRSSLPSKLPPELRTVAHAPALLLQQCSTLFRHGGYWHGTRAVLEQQLEAVFDAVLDDPGSTTLSATQLLSRVLANACLRLNVTVRDCLDSVDRLGTLIDNTPWHGAAAFLRKTSVPPVPLRAPVTPFTQDHLGHYLHDGRLPALARHLLLHGRAPADMAFERQLDLTRLLFDLSSQQPALLRSILKTLRSAPAVLFRLQQTMPLGWLLAALQGMAPQHGGTVSLIANLHHCLERVRLNGVTQQRLGSMLFVLVLKYWLAQDWRRLDIAHVLAEIALQLWQECDIEPLAFQLALAPLVAGQPIALRTAHQQLGQAASGAKAGQQSAPPKPDRQREAILRPVAPSVRALRTALATEPLLVSNAGLVILHSYFDPLFSRLGLMENGRFHDHSAQCRAVHLLQFLVTGHQETAEHHLMLNKVLCALPLDTPLESGITMSANEIAVCESLLNSVMQYWSAIGSSTLDGCRGNWLVRNGSLNDDGDHWQLTVDRRAYDILLKQAPFSYSMIRLKWMEKAVHVNWPT